MFSQLILNSNISTSDAFIRRYIETAPVQAIFYFQQLLSLSFQSDHPEKYDYILWPIAQAISEKRQLLRQDCMFKVFAAALECR